MQRATEHIVPTMPLQRQGLARAKALDNVSDAGPQIVVFQSHHSHSPHWVSTASLYGACGCRWRNSEPAVPAI